MLGYDATARGERSTVGSVAQPRGSRRVSQLRIFLLARDCNPDSISTPLIGYEHVHALARLRACSPWTRGCACVVPASPWAGHAYAGGYPLLMPVQSTAAFDHPLHCLTSRARVRRRPQERPDHDLARRAREHQCGSRKLRPFFCGLARPTRFDAKASLQD